MSDKRDKNVFYLRGSIRHFRKEKWTGAEICLAIISGIVIWDVLVSGFSLSLVTVPEVFAKDHSPQFRKSLNNNDRDQVL